MGEPDAPRKARVSNWSGMSSDQASARPRGAGDALRAAFSSVTGWLTPGSGEQSDGSKGNRRASSQPSWLRRHWIVASVIVVTLVTVGGVGGWLFYLNSQLGNIDRVPLTLAESKRPPVTEGEELNILIAGADNGPGPSIAADVAADRWRAGSHRSDTIMILHLPADRETAYLVSIPRDSYVKLYDENGDYTYTDKINAAFSLYGPSGYISTIEHLTKLRMDHLAIIDWDGFKDVTQAIGGVHVFVPETFYDDSQNLRWKKGWQTLEGQQALQYVRTRHGLANGDFDRIARQQNFLRAMMAKLLSGGVTNSPTKLTSALKAITANLTVDDGWSNGDIRDLALSVRGINTDEVTFLTAPLGRYDTSDNGQSVVLLDPKKSKALWRALADGELDRYAARHSGDTLRKPDKVK